MKGKNQRNLKEENTSTVLRLVRDNPHISRIEVVRRTDLTPPTVSRIINFLISKGVVSEKRGETRNVGRKPFYLNFEGDNFLVLAIELSYTYVRFGVIDLLGNIKEIHELETSIDISNKELFEIITKNTHLILNKYKKVIGIGISSPGRVDPKNGAIISVPNLKNFRNFKISDLSSYLKIPVFVSNDANAEALAEMYFGSCRDVSDFLLLHIGFGIGGGIVLNRKLYNGNFGVSGEIGHISIDAENGLHCDCGNRGCVELYTNLNVILKSIGSSIGKTSVSLEEAYSLLSKGNKDALKIVEKKGEIIGNVLVSIVNTIAPKKIVIAGPVLKIVRFIIPSIKEVISKRSFYGFGKEIEVVESSLRENSGLMGAMSIVLEEFLEHPYEFISQIELQ